MAIGSAAHDDAAHPEPLTDWAAVWSGRAWQSDVDEWLRQLFDERGERVLAITEGRVRMWSATRIIDTNAGRYWLKQNPQALAADAGVLTLAARVAPQLVLVPIVADTAARRIVTPDAVETLWRSSGIERPEALERMAATYADLQRALIPHVDDLRSAGATVVEPARLLEDVEEHLVTSAALPREHALHLDDAERDRIRSLARNALPHANDLAAAPIPLTLEHNDLHPGNVFETSDGVRISDFGDAVVGHPFASLRVLLGFLAREGAPATLTDRVREAYLERWSDFGTSAELRALADSAIAISAVQRHLVWSRTAGLASAALAEPYREYMTPLLGTLGDVDASLRDF